MGPGFGEESNNDKVTILYHGVLQVNPLDDIDVINLELALADLGQIEKRMERLKKGEQPGEWGGLGCRPGAM